MRDSTVRPHPGPGRHEKSNMDEQEYTLPLSSNHLQFAQAAQAAQADVVVDVNAN